MLRLAWIFRGIEKLRIKLGSTNRTERVLGKPSVSAFHMEPVVATRNQSSRLFVLDLVKAHRAFTPHHQFFSGDSGQLLQLGSRQALVGEGLDGKRDIGLMGSGVPEKAHVDHEDGAHAQAWQEKCQENGIKHFAFIG